MHYMLLAYIEPAASASFAELTPAERAERTAPYVAYRQALQAADVYVASGPLQAATTATTLRRDAGGAMQVLDGPFAETKEQLAGFFLIDVPDLDAALRWAKECPVLHHGACEVRPMSAMPT